MSVVKVLVLVALTTLGCRAPATRVPGPPSRPKLVVLLVIDQLPQWAFVVKRPALTAGFARLLREGQWSTGLYPTAATLTAPGHALLGTGQTPSETGILANEWWDRETQRRVRSIDGPNDTISARRMRVPGLGDAIAAARTGARAVGVSLKDRAAVLPLGQAGLAIWYDRRHASFTSSTPPGWLARLPPIRPRLTPWTPLDPVRLQQLSGVEDGAPGEVGEKGFGPTFPHDPTTTKHAADAVFAMPLGNALVFETAVAAIEGERLGADDLPDLLVLSLSANDYAGHGWGNESWESWDMMLRIDQELASFLAALDAKVGRGAWAMIVTSDHGASPMPERIGGGRLTFEAIARAANAAASSELGEGQWIAFAKYPSIYFTAAALAQPAARLAAAQTKVLVSLRALPGMARVERTADFAGHCATRSRDDQVVCLMLDARRSGELFYLLAPGWIHEDEDERLATAHGSSQLYDREVPVIVLAPGRQSHALRTRPGATVDMRTIAPTLARWLGVAL